MSEACFYTGSNYNGDKQCVNRGEYRNVTYDDRYTSATIPPNFIAVLYEHPNFDGETLRLDKDTPSFPRMDDKTWFINNKCRAYKLLNSSKIIFSEINQFFLS